MPKSAARPGAPLDDSVCKAAWRPLNFSLETTIGDIDLLAEVPGGGSYDLALPHSIEVIIRGEPVRVISLDKLIELKRAAGRPKDFEAIAELEKLRTEPGA